MRGDVKEQYALLLFSFDVPSIDPTLSCSILCPAVFCGGSAAVLGGAKRQWEELVAELDGTEGLVLGTGESSVAQAVVAVGGGRVWLVVLSGSSTTDESVVLQADDETGSLAIAGSSALAPQLVGDGVVPGSATVDSRSFHSRPLVTGLFLHRPRHTTTA